MWTWGELIIPWVTLPPPITSVLSDPEDWLTQPELLCHQPVEFFYHQLKEQNEVMFT